ncbi:MAG TPA: TetR family transcriptional regulator [Devosia sp.]|jgi:AcrR family transcriptional regulator|uniref:TetR/AcrR family transcriptional regulator n=1 Tax=Devosia sp. TaxID=1871048 RepID=UPI002DDD36C5|nr:TetR family transcriptional regulator [Devosia sp.]HEV2515194.1 TetR family transcriptional regulator [Devosia sp.]
MTSTSFQRARKPEEIQARRDTLLAAAAELFDAEGPLGAGLNAIAARAGFTKSNVYRYFESREEVLLSLFLAEMERLVPALSAAIAATPEGDLDALTRVVTAEFASRPRLGHLTSILSSTLETNVSEQTIVMVKRTMGGMASEMAAALRTRLPGASADDALWAITMIGGLVAGLWPGAHPAPVAERVLSRPEFARHRPSIERDLPRAVRAILASIA